MQRERTNVGGRALIDVPRCGSFGRVNLRFRPLDDVAVSWKHNQLLSPLSLSISQEIGVHVSCTKKIQSINLYIPVS